MPLLTNQRHLFDIPREVAYLNCAFMAPQLKAAHAAGEEALRQKAQPWRMTSTDFFTQSEETRALFARLIGAEADDIAFIPSVSYGMAVARLNLPLRAGQTVVIAAEEFPSGVYALAGSRPRERSGNGGGAAPGGRRLDRRHAGGHRRPHRGGFGLANPLDL